MALNRLYFITADRATTAGETGGAGAYALRQIEEACQAGIRLIQLRMKEASDEEFLSTAKEAIAICRSSGSRLILNDRVEIAAAVDADGVHVGKEDLPVREVRRILGAGKIVGGTANTAEDIREHRLGGADYVGLGPYRYTTTKKKLSPVLGLQGYQQIMRMMAVEGVSVPVFAIGGIGVKDIRGLMEAGVYGVAFSGLLVNASDRAAAVRDMEEKMRQSGVAEAEKAIKTI